MLELTGVAYEAKRRAVLVSEVFAAAANRLGTILRDVLVSLAPAPRHPARQVNGALLGKRFKVCFMLFIPLKIETQTQFGECRTLHNCLLNAHVIILILFLSFVICTNKVKVTASTLSISICFGQ